MSAPKTSSGSNSTIARHAACRRGRRTAWPAVVGGEQHRGAVLVADLAQQLQHFAAALRVEVAGGLVGEHELGLGRERPRDHHALALAHRELLGAVASAAGRVRDAPAAARSGACPRARRPRARASSRRSARRRRRAAGRRTGRRTRARASGSSRPRRPRVSRCRGRRRSPHRGRASSAAIKFSSVVLPEPLGPYSATSSRPAPAARRRRRRAPARRRRRGSA